MRAIGRRGGYLIQAGSFRSEDNAERARSLLGGIAPVEVAAAQAGGATLFRVRVGPFADQETAASALAQGDRGWLSRRENRYKLEVVLLAGCFFGSSAR